MALVFISFQQNDKRKILWIQAGSAAVFAAHFILLGAFTGMAMNFVEIPRNLVFAHIGGRPRQWAWTAVFVAAFVILGILAWENLFSLFPVCAMSLSTVVFSLQNPRGIRFFSLPVSALWMTYNLIVLSVAGTLTEGFCLCSILIAIFRFDVLKRTENSCRKNDRG